MVEVLVHVHGAALCPSSAPLGRLLNPKRHITFIEHKKLAQLLISQQTHSLIVSHRFARCGSHCSTPLANLFAMKALHRSTCLVRYLSRKQPSVLFRRFCLPWQRSCRAAKRGRCLLVITCSINQLPILHGLLPLLRICITLRGRVFVFLVVWSDWLRVLSLLRLGSSVTSTISPRHLCTQAF